MPGSPAHLVRRFFDVASARQLTDYEQAEVGEWVSGDLQTLFLAQDHADQRHGYEAARSVIELGRASPDVIEAALLHDIGKRHAGLGLVGRSAASVLIVLNLPLSARMSAYRDHGPVGSAELADAGAGSLAVDFALHHHDQRPESITRDVWETLVAADQPPKTRSRRGGPITSGH